MEKEIEKEIERMISPLQISVLMLTPHLRLKFKADLQCKPFSWFLQHVYPEKFILDDPKHVFAYGRLKNPTSATCLDNLQNDDKDTYELGQYACHNFMASAQFFSFSKKYELRREDSCAQVAAPFPQRLEKVN